MKKLVVTSIIAAMLLASGAAFGQAATDGASHDVRVLIPEVVMIRLTNGSSNAAVTQNTAVGFDLSATAPDDLIATHQPDVTDAWDDVKVFVNREVNWNVTVAVEQTDGPTGVTFPWNQISVTPSATGLASAFTLVSSATPIATSTARGWQSLGFGQGDFELELFGNEIVGSYTASVTYTLTAP